MKTTYITNTEITVYLSLRKNQFHGENGHVMSMPDLHVLAKLHWLADLRQQMRNCSAALST